MKFEINLKTAVRNLTASALRSFLAMIGISVGTASIIALLSGGSLATQQALEQIKNLGTDLVRIDINWSKAGPGDSLTVQDFTSIPRAVPGIVMLAPIAVASGSITYQKQTVDAVSFIGTTEDLAKIIHIKMDTGRFISDLDKSQNFCVLGANLVSKIKAIKVIGTYIKYGNSICRIIGTAAPWPDNNIANVSINDSLIIPIDAALNDANQFNLNAALLRIDETYDLDTITAGIKDYVQKRLPNFIVYTKSAKEILNSMAKQQIIFSLLLGLIGGVSLVVGGIGVMNIMLASVAERHSEIGLRMALGANPRDIQIMFLLEAAILAVIGGSMGVVAGLLVTLLIAYFGNWTFVIFIWPVILGFVASLLISLFFGYYPARIASQLNPIDTLRS